MCGRRLGTWSSPLGSFEVPLGKFVLGRRRSVAPPCRPAADAVNIISGKKVTETCLSCFIARRTLQHSMSAFPSGFDTQRPTERRTALFELSAGLRAAHLYRQTVSTPLERSATVGRASRQLLSVEFTAVANSSGTDALPAASCLEIATISRLDSDSLRRQDFRSIPGRSVEPDCFFDCSAPT